MDRARSDTLHCSLCGIPGHNKLQCDKSDKRPQVLGRVYQLAQVDSARLLQALDEQAGYFCITFNPQPYSCSMLRCTPLFPIHLVLALVSSRIVIHVRSFLEVLNVLKQPWHPAGRSTLDNVL